MDPEEEYIEAEIQYTIMQGDGGQWLFMVESAEGYEIDYEDVVANLIKFLKAESKDKIQIDPSPPTNNDLIN